METRKQTKITRQRPPQLTQGDMQNEWDVNNPQEGKEYDDYGFWMFIMSFVKQSQGQLIEAEQLLRQVVVVQRMLQFEPEDDQHNLQLQFPGGQILAVVLGTLTRRSSSSMRHLT